MLYSARLKLRIPFHSLAEARLRRLGCLDFLAHRPAQAFGPDYADLWFLYRMVRRRKPRLVLEFGSGCSTLVFAQALKDGPHPDAQVVSVETDSYWYEATERCLPAELRKYCRLIMSGLEKTDYAGVAALRHTATPRFSPDLLYVDGPQLPPDRQVIVDPLDLEPFFRPGFCMIIDGRPENARFLRQHLRRRYTTANRWLFDNAVMELKS